MTYMTPAQIQKKLEIGNTKFYRVIKEPDFPKGLKLTPKSRTVWESTAIDDWITEKLVA